LVGSAVPEDNGKHIPLSSGSAVPKDNGKNISLIMKNAKVHQNTIE